MAGTAFLAALAVFVYMCLRFLHMARDGDMDLLRRVESMKRNMAQTQMRSGGTAGELVVNPFAPQQEATDGDFIVNTDEESFLQEQIRVADSHGMKPEDIESFVRQAVTEPE